MSNVADAVASGGGNHEDDNRTGGEPEFTNLAKRGFSGGDEFCETLDYIWLSEVRRNSPQITEKVVVLGLFKVYLRSI